MKTTFEVSSQSYDAEIHQVEKPEGEKFEVFEVAVRGPDQGLTQGTLKLTEEALDTAARKAKDEGGSAEEWLARGCGRALAAEVVIRKLSPDFSFVVDYRWIDHPSA
jgi:hypothetical protein